MHVGARVYVFIMGVLTSVMLPFGVFAAETTSTSSSTILHVLQVVWAIAAVIAFLVLLYGFIQLRRSRDDLITHAQSKRIVLLSSIALGLALLLFGVLTFFIFIKQRGETNKPSTITTPTEVTTPLAEEGISNIIQHYPTRDQRNVPRNTPILITFKDELNIASVQTGQGMLDMKAITIQHLQDDDKPIGDPMTAHVQSTDDNKTIKINTDQLLGVEGESSTKYKVTVLPSVQNSQHISMMGGTGSYSWVFYVGTAIDTAPPQVVSIFPGNEKEPVARNAMVQIMFSKAIDPTTVKKSFFQFENTTTHNILDGTITIHNNYKTVIFTPSEVCGSNACNQRIFCLPANSRISGRIKTASIVTPRDAARPNAAHMPYDGVTDTQGNALDGGGENGLKKDGIAQGTHDDDYTWMFSTTSIMDTTAPLLVSVQPGRNGTNVDVNAPIQARFSKIMDTSSLLPSAIILDKGIRYWIDSTSDNDTRQTIANIVHDPLKDNTTYSPSVANTVRDIYQNCFSSCAGPLQ